MRCKGIQATFRIPIVECDGNGVVYDLDTYVPAVRQMIGAPVTNGDGSQCYGIITDVTMYDGDTNLTVEAMLFSGGTVEYGEDIDGVVSTRNVLAFALTEDWTKVSDLKYNKENVYGINAR